MESLKRPKLLALTALLGGVTGVAADAAADTCSCLPSTNTRSGGTASFFLAATAHFRAYIDSDQIYGFQSDTASPTVYVDYTSPGPGTFGQVCRLSYTGASVQCATVTATDSTASGNLVDLNVPTSGLNSFSNSQWDRYIADIGGPLSSTDAWRFKGWSAMEASCG